MKIMEGEYKGIYRAYVARNTDPLEMGRVQVRIPFLHGIVGNDFSAIKDKDLPYAMPCFPVASYDSGMCLIPEVGSIVFVFFENGNCDEPVYFGQCYGKADEESIKTYGYPSSKIFRNSKGKKQKRATIDEIPQNVYKNGKVNRFILYKSTKGQSIEINDNDGEESFNIYDRDGQTFSMSAPESRARSSKGLYNRGVFTVLKEKFTKKIYKTAIIVLKALSGSKLRFVSNESHYKTDLICVYKDLEAGISMFIGNAESTSMGNSFNIEDLKGEEGDTTADSSKSSRLLIFYGNSKIEVKENSISLESETIDLNANTINLKASTINTSSKIKVSDALNINNIEGFSDKDEESKIK